MRRLFLATSLAAAAALSPLVPACTSSTATSTPATDSSIPPGQVLGAACDPTLAKPCAPVPQCFIGKCDLIQLVCVEEQIPGCFPGDVDAAGIIGSDAGATDAPVVSSGCVSDAQCKNGNRCGYPVVDGCSATGICVPPDVPTTDGGQPYIACGCHGEALTYVTPTMTSGPAASGAPCVDASVVDASGDETGDATGDDSSADAAGE